MNTLGVQYQRHLAAIRGRTAAFRELSEEPSQVEVTGNEVLGLLKTDKSPGTDDKYT